VGNFCVVCTLSNMNIRHSNCAVNKGNFSMVTGMREQIIVSESEFTKTNEGNEQKAQTVETR